VSLTQYYTATTLDGFIADPDNSLDWLFVIEQGEDGPARWNAFIGAVGAMAMGATTYQWILDHERMIETPERWQDAYADRPCWVFTHHDLPPVAGADVRFVRDDVAGAHQDMVAAAGDRNVWLVGGGDLVGQFHDAGLLDQVIASVAPVTLGAGAPLLPRRIQNLRLTSVEQNGQFANLTYDVVHS
jgi:dihydrofolate reductase